VNFSLIVYSFYMGIVFLLVWQKEGEIGTCLSNPKVTPLGDSPKREVAVGNLGW